MRDIAALLEEPDTSIAVVGATDNPSKYGNIIYRDMRRKGYRVFAVNPKRDMVAGDPCYATLADLPEAPTIVDYVVPPEVTLKVLAEALELGMINAWVQPGAESPAVVDFLQENGFNYLAHACIMVESRMRA